MKITSEEQLMKAIRKVAADNLVLVEGAAGGALETRRKRLLEDVASYDEQYNADRVGDWLTTVGGRRFWHQDPRPSDVHVDDVAHALSMQCRFAGHVRRYYSVAQHSVLVSRVVQPWAALAGLLHDAAEAYLGDVITPVKRMMPDYRTMEAAVMRAVCSRFDVKFDDEHLWAEVKRADEVLLSTEFRDVARRGCRMGMPRQPPMKEKIGRCWTPTRAKREFLARFDELYG